MKQNPINVSAKVQLFLDSAKFFLFFCANGYIFIVFGLFGVQHITLVVRNQQRGNGQSDNHAHHSEQVTYHLQLQ